LKDRLQGEDGIRATSIGSGAKLEGCALFLKYRLKAACYQFADDFGGNVQQVDSSPVVWVGGVSFFWKGSEVPPVPFLDVCFSIEKTVNDVEKY